MESKIPYRYRPRGVRSALITQRILIGFAVAWGIIVLITAVAVVQS